MSSSAADATDQSVDSFGAAPEGDAMEGQLQVVVGENLRRLRRQMGFSQESFGEHVGWHRTFVGAVERGERNLTLRTVERLATQLNVHPLALLFDGVATFQPVLEPGQASRPVTFAADHLRAEGAAGGAEQKPDSG